MSKVIFFFSHVSNDIKADILMTYRTIYEVHLSKKKPRNNWLEKQVRSRENKAEQS